MKLCDLIPYIITVTPSGSYHDDWDVIRDYIRQFIHDLDVFMC
jgi:hypothetical protein